MKKYTLITGGASGLGLELSKLFARDKENLFLISSNQKNLDNAKEILKEYQVEVLTLQLDLSDPNNFKKVDEYVKEHDIHVKNLVNCAGYGDRCDFKDMDIDKQIRMVELNCNAPMYLMRLFINEMINDNEGHIINIASIASFFPGPYMVTYHATKDFLLNISLGIERELKGTNVRMTIVCPGPFDSGFVSKAHNDYTFSKIKPISTEKAARISYKAYKKKKSIKIIGFKNSLLIFISRFVPRKLVASSSAKNIKKV